MKRILPILLSIIIVYYFYNDYNNYNTTAQAQFQNPIGSQQTQVSATVGELALSVSGFISPYASIVMTSGDGVFLRAAVADEKGNFSISQMLIKKGFSKFCLNAVDFKRIGESTTCFSFPPAKQSITMNNLFLPPTLGLSKTEVAEGSTVLAFGYTMPGATVVLHLSNGKTITATADATGYYSYNLKDLKAGSYDLFTKAYYKEKESLAPTKNLKLKSLSFWEQIVAFLRDLWKKFLSLITAIALGPLWLAIPILILIIILLRKLYPSQTWLWPRQTWLRPNLLKKKKLHHAWFIGY